MRNESYWDFDIILFISVIALISIGIMFIYSSGITSTGENISSEYIKQILSALFGIILLFAVTFGNYNRIKDYTLYIYILFVCILIFTLLFGKTVNGAKAWLTLGPYHLGQPSELMKIVTVLALAAYLDDNKGKIHELGTLATGFLIVLLPFMLIMLQPDMGTALVYLPIFYAMSFVSGAKTRYLLFTVLVGIMTVSFAILPAYEKYFSRNTLWLNSILTNERLFYTTFFTILFTGALSFTGYIIYKRRYFYWINYLFGILILSLPFSHILSSYLKDYQLMRFMVFLDPEVDPRGSGWHIIQSITAVGNGGLFGKGFLQGTQSHYRFLPQQSTDFIFSILAEEWGFAGCLVVVVLFGIIIYRAFRIMINSRDFYGMIISAGIISILFFHFVVNIGMAIGIMPITGIPLIFLSYGGSSLLGGLLGIGLLLNIYIRKYRY